MPIKLEKSGDSHKIDLNKTNTNESVTINVNLDWEEVKPSGFLKSLFQSSQNLDLDLGCMYELQNGKKGVIQAVGKSFGSQIQSPFIYLDKDDRTGATEGENMYIYRPNLLKRVMIFAYIYDRNGNFQTVNARLRLISSDSQEIFLTLDNPDIKKTFCAAATIDIENNKILITKQEKYFNGHKESDEYFKFGFNWVAGSKD